MSDQAVLNVQNGTSYGVSHSEKSRKGIARRGSLKTCLGISFVILCQILTLYAKYRLNSSKIMKYMSEMFRGIIFSENKNPTGRSTTLPRACNQSQTIQLYQITSIYLGGVMGYWGWGNIHWRIHLFGYFEQRVCLLTLMSSMSPG
jgi:hypothetical protein